MRAINSVGFLLFFVFLTKKILVDCAYGEKRTNDDETIDRIEKRLRVSSASTSTETSRSKLFHSDLKYQCNCGKEFSWNGLVDAFYNSQAYEVTCPVCIHQHSFADFLAEIKSKAREPVQRIDKMGVSRPISKQAALVLLIMLNADFKDIEISSDQSIATFQVEWAGQPFKLEMDNQVCLREYGIDLMKYSLKACGVFGNIKLVRLLISLGVDVNSVSKRHNTILHNTIRHKKLNLIKYLLEIGARTDIESENCGFPTHYALRAHNLLALQLLLKAGADLKSVDKCGKTILSKATETDNLAALALLSQFYPESTLNFRSIVERIIETDDFRAMMNVIELGIGILDAEHEIIRLAAAKSSKVFSFLTHYYRNSKSFAIISFCSAFKAGRADNIEVLKSRGFQINDQGSNGRCVLSYAISVNDEILFDNLVEMGATWDEIQGEAFLHEAITKKNVRIVQSLLKSTLIFKHNSDARAIRALIHACKIGDLEVIEELMSLRDIFPEDSRLNAAFLSGNIDILKQFLKRGFIHKSVDGTVSWFMHDILMGADIPDLIQTILECGANLYKDPMTAKIYDSIRMAHPSFESRLTHVDTPAVTALLYSRTESMRLFLEYGFNPNYRIFSGSTTFLHLACELNNVAIAKLLIQYGADTNALDNNNKPPFSYIDNSEMLSRVQDINEFL